MPSYPNLKLQHTGQNVSVLIRELNSKLDTLRLSGNQNFLESYPQVDAVIDQNADVSVWISPGDYEIDRWFVYASNVTPNPTLNLRLNGVNVDTQTPTSVQVYEYELSAVEPVTRLDRVSINVAALAAGGIATVGIGLRRLN